MNPDTCCLLSTSFRSLEDSWSTWEGLLGDVLQNLGDIFRHIKLTWCEKVLKLCALITQRTGTKNPEGVLAFGPII